MSLFSDSILIDLIGTILALVLVTVSYLKWHFKYWARRNIPVIESTMDFSWTNIRKIQQTKAENTIFLYNQIKAKKLKFCGSFNMLEPILVVSDLDLIRHILTKDFHYFSDRPDYVNKNELIRKNLFFKTGKDWHDLRTKLTPMFTTGKMRSILPMVLNSAKTLEDFIAEKCKKNEAIDMKEVLGRFTVDVMASSIFGIELNSFQNPNSPFRFYISKLFEGNILALLRLLLTINFPNLAQFFGINFLQNSITNFFSKTVLDMIEYREKNKIVRKDFLQFLVDLKNSEKSEKNGTNKRIIGFEEIVSQCLGFFAGGFEPTAHITTIALYEMALQPDIQIKLRDEINSVLGKYGSEITYDSIQEMTYLDQVFDETMRKYSTSAIQRRCVKDYKIPGTDCAIEKGTRIYLPLLGIHFDPEYYPDPGKFDPDRFSEENKRKRLPYSYFPFDIGPRHCIGLRFATMISKVSLISVLRNYEVLLSSKSSFKHLTPEEYSQTVGTHGLIWLNLEKVKGN